MATTLRITALILIAAALASVGCGDDDDSTTTAGTSDTPSAEEAQAVLEGVIDRDISDPGYHVGGFKSDPAVSETLKAAIEQVTADAKRAGATGLDFDPFVCAQQVPTSVGYTQAGVAAGRVTFVGRQDYGGQASEKVTYVMALAGDEWQLDSTECVDAALPKGE